MYYGYYFDPTMIILVPAIILAIYAQFKVGSTTSKFLKVKTRRGLTGEQVARLILNSNGLNDVSIEMSNGRLSDHYDPRNRVVRLSREVYYETTITSVAVAAHECGHAIQHAKGYLPLNLRSSIFPIVSLASNLSWLFLMLGFILSGPFIKIGIIMFSASVVFQIVTLPVEFNASKRGIDEMEALNIIDGEEISQSKKVLSAAALTYVAAALTSILELVRLLVITNNSNDD